MGIELSAKQNEYIVNANARWNLKVGAVRSGKSFVDIAYVIPSRLRAVAGRPGLNVIMGVSRGTIERNVLEPMREIYTDKLVGRINNDNQAKICGENVYCLGAEKVSQVAKIQGASIKYCYGDEVAKWNEEVFELLKSRLDKEYSCFDGSLNPEGPNHWLKKFLDTQGLSMYSQHYVIDDNPFLPPEYVENLKKEYEGMVYYDRYILGLWALAEGLIFPMYKDAIVERIPDGAVEERCISIDYGTMNAFCMLLWERKGDVWYATRRYYYSGRETGMQKTDNDYLKDMETVLYDVIEDRKRFSGSTILSGESSSKIQTIIDPSAASFIALLKKTKWAKVIKADNAVLDGIRETASAMYQGKIKISASIPEFRKEAEGYVWDEGKNGIPLPEEKPIKVNDHCISGDTLVLTESGEIPIKALVGKIGRVWSYNIETEKAELKSFYGCRITRRFEQVFEVKTESGKCFKCTGDHLLLTDIGWMEAYGCTMLKIISTHGEPELIISVRDAGYEDVYNMEVEDNHNFTIVGGLVVHNCMDAVRYFVKTKKIVKVKRTGGSRFY